MWLKREDNYKCHKCLNISANIEFSSYTRKKPQMCCVSMVCTLLYYKLFSLYKAHGTHKQKRLCIWTYGCRKTSYDSAFSESLNVILCFTETVLYIADVQRGRFKIVHAILMKVIVSLVLVIMPYEP